ncbi:MAG TPA: polysaccharide biosynthesis tyrosine autokinase [Acidimicrobiales bacterium]|nr:polysaccharide biosynthesis tyrosine autokinase [Acidimicrobiales bacterium]
MDVVDYLGVLRRRWLAIVVCILAAVAGAMAITRSTTEQYRSSARLFVNVPAARGIQEALQGVQLSSGLLRSYAAVATSRAAAQRIIDDLELDQSAGSLSRQLRAVPQEDTLLITISADDRDPVRAEALAGAAAEVFIELVDEFEQGRAERIEARIIDEATTPVAPFKPKPERNLAVGLVLGLGLGLAVAFLVEALDRSVKTPDQATASVGAPVLAVVPRRKRPDVLLPDLSAGDPAAEAFRSLRTSIQFLGSDVPVRSIMITSPSAGEGKSSTAANLAIAFAQSGARVVAVDGDLRRARLTEALGAQREVGLTSVLFGQSTLSEALVPVMPNLHVLPSGPLPPNPAELIGSEAMAQVMAALDDAGHADVTIVDVPPIMPVTDAVALSTQVQAVVMVLRAGRTEREVAKESARRLAVVGAGLIGCVLNGVARSGATRYQQDYRYAASGRRNRKVDD